jgi:SAM-dependent methyltransferase
MSKRDHYKRDYYDARGRGAEETRAYLLHREEVALQLLRSHLQPSTCFLDIGCGDGFFLTQVHQTEPCAHLAGLDMSEHQLTKARPILPSAQFTSCDLDQAIPVTDGSTDTAYAGELIEHLYNPDFFLKECRRVLRPGGLLVLTTPNLSAWYNRILFLLGTQPLFMETSTELSTVGAGFTRPFRGGSYPVGHIRIFTLQAITDLLELHGFEVHARRSALFEAFTGPLRSLDRAMTTLPTLGSISVVAARASEGGTEMLR